MKRVVAKLSLAVAALAMVVSLAACGARCEECNSRGATGRDLLGIHLGYFCDDCMMLDLDGLF